MDHLVTCCRLVYTSCQIQRSDEKGTVWHICRLHRALAHRVGSQRPVTLLICWLGPHGYSQYSIILPMRKSQERISIRKQSWTAIYALGDGCFHDTRKWRVQLKVGRHAWVYYFCRYSCASESEL